MKNSMYEDHLRQIQSNFKAEIRYLEKKLKEDYVTAVMLGYETELQKCKHSLQYVEEELLGEKENTEKK